MAPSWAATLEKRKIDLLFTDPPYNLPSRTIGKACADKHGDFQQASGEMSEKEFRAFLERFCLLAKIRTAAGAIAFVCIDWRHVHMMIAAGLVHFPEFKNLCVWNKSSAGMGSFYRNQHELILVFKMSEGAHQNNIQLGKYGRNRSNVWDYPSVQSFEPKEGDMEKPLDFHGTQKPVRMIEDAILDVTRKGDLVFDPFLGAGSTLIACEKAERVCCGVEIEPKYMDVILHRWEQWTGQTARLLVRAGEQADDE